MNCGGLGDRLLGMTSAFFFGLITQRSVRSHALQTVKEILKSVETIDSSWENGNPLFLSTWYSTHLPSIGPTPRSPPLDTQS